MSAHGDDELRRLLRTWNVSPANDPNLVAAVWRRIAIEEASDGIALWPRLRGWILVRLPRPACVASVLAATIVLSGLVAVLQANHSRDRIRVENARLYLADIDPLSMAITQPHASP